MGFWLQLSYRARVRVVLIVLVILAIDVMGTTAVTQARQRAVYEDRIEELQEEIQNKDAELHYSALELHSVKEQYRGQLMEVARAVYEREYYSMGGYSTQEGAEVTAIYEAIMNEAQDYRAHLVDVDNYFDARKDYIENIPSVWPVEYNELTSITSGFGERISPISGDISYHGGIDISGVWNAAIIATADGVVQEHWLPPGNHWGVWYDGHEDLGGMIKIGHDGGFSTVYGHMERTFVREGMVVKRGDVIGIMGNTGTSRGRHLHYEILRDERPVNPIDYLQF